MCCFVYLPLVLVSLRCFSKERTFSELYRPQDLLAKCREICDSLAKGDISLCD